MRKTLWLSLVAALGSFALLHRLAEPKLGPEGASRAVLYLAIFPFAVFLQAVYSEAVFLLFALAAFVLAERGRFLGAGVATGLAWLTRPLGHPYGCGRSRRRDRAAIRSAAAASARVAGRHPASSA